jgi:NADH:ubiquinone oxidoreductase subunit 5 (subunit L)/multisubunit Na+/H+ antiporter MnhA subunit
VEDLKTQTPDDERQVAERKVGRSFSRGVQRKDPIFEEKITLQSEAGNKTAPLRCGNMDMTFLLIVLALLLYGVIMAYSASSVYSEQNVGESTYYLKRHLMFVMLALAASSLLNAVYFMRTLIRIYSDPRGTVSKANIRQHHKPLYNVPMVILGGLNLFLGLFSWVAINLITQGLKMFG